MTRDELLAALDVERYDRTFWNLPPAPTSPSSERMRQWITDADKLAVRTRRRDVLTAIEALPVDNFVGASGYRHGDESSTQTGEVA